MRLPRKRAVFILLFIGIAVSFGGRAQTITKIKEWKAKGAESLTVDRLGNFFLIFKNGAIKKYDPDGKLLASLKGGRVKPTLVEPWYHPSIFVYKRQSQEWIIYDRELKNPQVYNLDPSVAISPYLICPTNDNKLLVFDKADYSVKRINRFTNELIAEFAIDTTAFLTPPDITFMREYQNMVFLLDGRSGILVFNNIGKLINRIGQPGIRNFGFYGEEIFYVCDNTVVLFDIYSEKIRLVPIAEKYYLYITDERLIGLEKAENVVLFKFEDLSRD